MTRVPSLFQKHALEYRHFERVQNPPSPRRDLCAFLLIDKLVPDQNESIINDTSENGDSFVYLNLYPHQLENFPEEQIVDLIRCGVSYNEYSGHLYMET
jgi:hypothetical protein